MPVIIEEVQSETSAPSVAAAQDAEESVPVVTEPENEPSTENKVEIDFETIPEDLRTLKNYFRQNAWLQEFGTKEKFEEFLGKSGITQTEYNAFMEWIRSDKDINDRIYAFIYAFIYSMEKGLDIRSSNVKKLKREFTELDNKQPLTTEEQTRKTALSEQIKQLPWPSELVRCVNKARGYDNPASVKYSRFASNENKQFCKLFDGISPKKIKEIINKANDEIDIENEKIRQENAQKSKKDHKQEIDPIIWGPPKMGKQSDSSTVRWTTRDFNASYHPIARLERLVTEEQNNGTWPKKGVMYTQTVAQRQKWQSGCRADARDDSSNETRAQYMTMRP